MTSYKITLQNGEGKKRSYEIKAPTPAEALRIAQSLAMGKYIIFEIAVLSEVEKLEELNIDLLEEYLTIKEFASIKGVTVQAIYKQLNKKKYKPYLVKNRKYLRLKKEALLIDTV